MNVVFSPLPLSTKTQCLKLHFSSGVQEKMGIMNRGVVYALWDYSAENPDELSFHEGDCMTIVRREDEDEIEWWWARMGDTEGYIPRNLLGVSYESAYYQCSILGVKMWIINMFFVLSSTALPQNKTKTEDAGLKYRNPCTFPLWQNFEHTHMHRL